METGAALAACFALMGGGKSALQHVIAQKEGKDSNPEPALVGFSCCETMQCYILWSQSNMTGWERSNIKIDVALNWT